MSDAFNAQTPSPSALHEAIRRLREKLSLATEAVDHLRQDRIRLEAKIEDAQSRIQHILSRLPEQNDVRQLNLLGGTESAPTSPDDDHEPTTH